MFKKKKEIIKTPIEINKVEMFKNNVSTGIRYRLNSIGEMYPVRFITKEQLEALKVEINKQ